MPTQEDQTKGFSKILECAKGLPPLGSALILYNDKSSEIADGFFEKQVKFLLSEIPIFPVESTSSATATLTLGVIKTTTYALVTDIHRIGLSPHESVVLALLLKALGVKHAFTVVVTGIQGNITA